MSPTEPGLRNHLLSFFEVSARGSTLKTELLAGISTFLALAYIVVVNPAILAEAGIDRQAVFFATVLTSGIATLLMGLWARLPFALAPGMEMNAYVAFFVVGTLGFSWQQALGAVFWSGVVFLALSISGIRERIMRSIPARMKAGLALSVGVFIALVALKICGLLVFDGVRIAGPGEFWTLDALALALSLGIILALNVVSKKVPGGVLISIIATALVLGFLGRVPSVVSPVPAFGDMLKTLAQLDLAVILQPRAWSVILVLFLVDFYGSVAKLVGLTAATSLDRGEGPPRLKEALTVDSAATVGGAILGTSNITVYVESGVGISEGGRTGLTAVVCGVGLLLCLPLASAIQYIPVVATSGALVFVAISLFPKVRELRSMDRFEVVALVAMQIAVVLTFAVDRAFLVGAVCYIVRGLWRKETPDAYLVGSAVILTLGLALQ